MVEGWRGWKRGDGLVQFGADDAFNWSSGAGFAVQLAGHLLAAAGNGMDEGGRVGHSSALLRRNAGNCARSKN